MAGFDAPLIEYADGSVVSHVEKRKAAEAFIEERKTLIEFIRNFRRGREAYYRYEEL